MNLIRYNRPIFPRRFSDAFESLFEENNDLTKVSFQPKVTISENEKSFSVNAELPGVNKEDIHVDLEENSLTLSGVKKIEKEVKKDNYHLVESSFGDFSRTFYLPDNINKDKIEAKYEDGILKLSIPKKEKEKIVNTIKIK